MRINAEYLREFVNVDPARVDLKELLDSIGIEAEEIFDCGGQKAFELEVTPNRPDWLSHYGVAREIHAKLPHLELSFPELYELKDEIKKEEFSINIENSQDCGRYTGCVVRNIEVAESSSQVKTLLKSLGLRPINNIVDISNLVVMTLGQPIHIFDLDKLTGKEINVRRGRPGEKMKLLDEREIELDEGFLVIAGQEYPVALAGIMGGYDSGVTFASRHILIESAYFDPLLIRNASKALGISTDASYRFERGGDILVTRKAVEYTLGLIKENQQQDLHITYLGDPFPRGFSYQFLELKKDFPAKYSGIPIDENLSCQILGNLGFKLEDRGDSWTVKVPSYRVDIYGKQDLVEEITRIYGYDKLESQIPLVSNLSVKPDKQREVIEAIRSHFTALGFSEVINYSFHSAEENRLVVDDDRHERFIEIKNPLGKDFSVMRNSILPGLLKNTILNFNHAVDRVSLFEVGRVFLLENNEIIEKDILGISASGQHLPLNWRNKKEEAVDLFLFKSLISGLLKKFYLDFKFEEMIGSKKYLREGSAFTIVINSKYAGYFGELKKDIADRFKLEYPFYAAEIELSSMLDHLKENKFEAWNRFPLSKRDFSFLIDKSIKYRELEAEIENAKPENLESYALVDKYEGQNIPADKVSLSMSFAYRSKDKTLTNEEVNQIHNDFIKRLIQKSNLIQR